MSGVKINVDAVRNKQDLGKSVMVMEEVNLDDILNSPSQESKENEAAVSNVEIKEIHVEDDTLEVALKAPSDKKSEPRVTVVTTDQKSSSKGISAPSDRTTPQAVAEEIKSAFRSAARSSRASGLKGLADVPVAASSTIRVVDPIDSVQRRMQQEDEVREHFEEIDMMPRTDAEKHLYWKTKLQILKTSYKDVTIPSNAADLAWRELRKMYYIERDRVSIGKNVTSYMLVMIVMFFIVEMVGSKFKLNITGFTVHSIKSMHRYQRLLIELGEKEYAGFGEDWPVEVRLAGLVLVNAVIFCIAKYVFSWTKQDKSEEFFQLFSQMGNMTVDDEIAPNAGLDTPAPGGGGGGGIGDILGSVLGGLGGGGGGGGLGSLLGGLFGGGAPGGTAPRTAPAASGDPPAEGESRIPKPKRARRRKPRKPVEE